MARSTRSLWQVCFLGVFVTMAPGCSKESSSSPHTSGAMYDMIEVSGEEAKMAQDDDVSAAAGKTWKRSTLSGNTSRILVGDNEALPLHKVEIRTRIDGFRARVMLDLFFENDRHDGLEGTFQLRLPEGASPYFLAFGQTVATTG